MDAQTLIDRLGLEPLPEEGGYYREIYRSPGRVAAKALPDAYASPRCFCTAIYYLVTPEQFSALHRLPGDELFHFYAGDPVEMLQLHPDGHAETLRIGLDLERGERPFCLAPGGVWQGTRLVPGGRFALLGVTVAPGFEFEDFEPGNREALLTAYPDHREAIVQLTRA